MLFAKYPSLPFCQMADVVENEAKMAYMRPPAAAMDEQRGPSKGFVVREAPWTTASEKVSIYTSLIQFEVAINITSVS